MEWEKLARVLEKQNWIILMILGAASFFLMSPVFTLGIILGGLIIIANFNLLQHTICCAFSPDGVMRPKKRSIIAKSYLRLGILGIIICILLKKAWVDPVGLCIGLSIVVVSIIYLGIRVAWKTSSREAI